MTEITLAVRDLVQFCYREGDIDHRFSPSPTAAQGIEGHRRVYRRRPDTYRPEYPLEYRFERGGQRFLLRGRADGYDPQELLLEEIKTCRVDFAQIPGAVSRMHLAQGRLYAAMLASAEEVEQLELRLTWLHVDSGEEWSISEPCERAGLLRFLQDSLVRFAHWTDTLAQLRRVRDDSLRRLDFPHGKFRPGQREIAELVYKCVHQQGQLMVEAPTGIGKTAAALYPALKALAAGRHDALVYLTARIVGRRAAEDTLALFRQRGFRGAGLSLTAKEGICLSPGSACHGDDCPYARGYYDRLPEAMAAAVALPALRREELQELAQNFEVCPYQLGLDLVPWMDLVIADLHYLYSLTPLLGGQMERDGRRWTALLDEAHNLPSRARDMYRAELAKAELMAVKRAAPAPLASSLERVNRVLLALGKEVWEEADFDSRVDLPAELTQVLQGFTAAVGEQLAADPMSLQRRPALLDFYFKVLQWQRVAEQWGEDFQFELHRGRGRQGLRVVLNCLEPSRLLAARQRPLHAVTAFSATLSPAHWCRPALGFGEQAVCARQASPFVAEQLQVYLATHVDTRYHQREASLTALAGLLRDWLAQEPGNCLVYFPSYRYLEDALRELGEIGGDRHCWIQERGADRDAQYQLLDLLRERRDVVAFCILGGIFGEGVDLPGDQLASVIVVGVGLPQVNRDTRRLRDWYQARGNDGFALAYLYPGMQKVDQALGRVVRRLEDRGRALLVDSRYRQREYRELLPPWWQYRDWGEWTGDGAGEHSGEG